MDVTKVVKKRYINKSITVMTRKDLADALKERYANITVEGDLGVRLYKEMNGFCSKQEVADKVFAKIFDTSSLKVLTKLLKDYKMVSTNAAKTVIVLKDSKKGFEK